MDATQSFLLTVARGGVSSVGQRIIMQIVAHIQDKYKDNDLPARLVKGRPPRNLTISVAASEVLGASKHYEAVSTAFIELTKLSMSFWTGATWVATSLVYNVSTRRGSGVYTFSISEAFAAVLWDFSHGYTRYNLENALSLSRPSAMRMYALMSNQKKPITMPIEAVRAMFDDTQYKQTADFIKRIIKPAADELELRGFNGFSYAFKRGARSAITHITFIPIQREQTKTESIVARLHLSSLVPRDLRTALVERFDFSSRELGAHKILLSKVAGLDWPAILERVQRVVQTKGKGKGYVIGALRREVQRAGV